MDLAQTVWALGLTPEVILLRLPTLCMKLVRILNRGKKALTVLMEVLHRPAGETT